MGKIIGFYHTDRDNLIHPNAPAGGCGPGASRCPTVLGQTPGTWHPDAPESRNRALNVSPTVRKTLREEKNDGTNAENVNTFIKELRKRAHKIVDYLNYLEYLKTNNPVAFEKVMDILKEQDPKTWAKLVHQPRFRPMGEAMDGGIKVGEKIVGIITGTVSGAARGNPVNAVEQAGEKWLEHSVSNLMRRDNAGPYDQRAKILEKDAMGVRGLRGAGARALTSTATPFFDFALASLDSEIGTAVGDIQLDWRISKLERVGALDHDQWEEAKQLLSNGRRAELNRYLEAALRNHLFR